MHITFLGLEIDIQSQQVTVAPEKMKAAFKRLKSTLAKDSVTLKHLQSLLGHLNLLTRALSGARTFLECFVTLTRGITHKSQKIELCTGSKKNLEMWVTFLQSFNGSRMILANELLSSEVIELYTDAAKSIGFGAYYSGHWFQWNIRYSGGYSIAYL